MWLKFCKIKAYRVHLNLSYSSQNSFPSKPVSCPVLQLFQQLSARPWQQKWSLRHWQQLSKSEPGELVVACLLLLPRVLPFSHRCRLGVALITKNPNSTVKNFLSFSHAIDWFVENRNRKGQNKKSVELGNQLAAAQLTEETLSGICSLQWWLVRARSGHFIRSGRNSIF